MRRRIGRIGKKSPQANFPTSSTIQYGRPSETLYGIQAKKEFATRFEKIIKAAYNQTGKEVVVLVDEYDKPLLNKNVDFAINPIPTLYQCGFLTINGYNPHLDTYTLGVPNQEVRDAIQYLR